MHVSMTRFSEHKWGKTVCMQFLMVVISKMAHKVDLGRAERQISESLNSKMLHQEYAVCASVEQGVGVGWGEWGCPEYIVCMHAALSKHC